MPDLKAVQGGTDLPGQSTTKPTVALPGAQPATLPTPAPPATTQIGTRPPAPVGWYDPIDLVRQIMELLSLKGPAAAVEFQSTVNRLLGK